MILPTTADHFPGSTCLGIVNNGQTWQAGIVIRHDAIEGTDGTTGYLVQPSISPPATSWGGMEKVAAMVSGKLHHQLPTPCLATRFNSKTQARCSYRPAGASIFPSETSVAASTAWGITPAITGGSPYIETLGVTRRRTWISNQGRRQHAPIRG